MHGKATIRITDLPWLKVIEVRTANQESEHSADLEMEVARPYVRNLFYEGRRIILQSLDALVDVITGIFTPTPEQ